MWRDSVEESGGRDGSVIAAGPSYAGGGDASRAGDEANGGRCALRGCDKFADEAVTESGVCWAGVGSNREPSLLVVERRGRRFTTAGRLSVAVDMGTVFPYPPVPNHLCPFLRSCVSLSARPKSACHGR